MISLPHIFLSENIVAVLQGKTDVKNANHGRRGFVASGSTDRVCEPPETRQFLSSKMAK
jgi:hypothetical protein